MSDSLRDYYAICGIPKVNPNHRSKAAPQRSERPKAKRARRDRHVRKAAGDDREVVFARQGHVCFCHGINPKCQGRVKDPHELIPVGIGGKRVSSNRVGVCRACHREAQGRVGGVRLIFTWRGQKQGRPPNADVPGNVSCKWIDKKEKRDRLSPLSRDPVATSAGPGNGPARGKVHTLSPPVGSDSDISTT